MLQTSQYPNRHNGQPVLPVGERLLTSVGERILEIAERMDDKAVRQLEIGIKAMNAKLGIAPGMSRDEALKAMAMSDITGAGHQTPPTHSWFGVFGQSMFLDRVVMDELRFLTFEEADPAGNYYDRWEWGTPGTQKLLADAESATAGTDATLLQTSLTPVHCQAVTIISVAALDRLVRRWDRARKQLDVAGYALAEADFLVTTFAYAAMASKIYADICGGLGGSYPTVYNGIIHNLANNTNGTPVTSYAHPGGNPDTLDWPNTVLPAIRNAAAGNARMAQYLMDPDLYLYCSIQEREAILAQTQRSDDLRGYVTRNPDGTLNWLGVRIVSLRAWPNAELVMTVRQNMLSLLVEAPMTVERYKRDPAAYGQYWVIAVPMTSIAGVRDGAAAVYVS